MLIQYLYYIIVTKGASLGYLANIKNFVSDLYRCDIRKSVVLSTAKCGTVWYFGIHLGLLLCLPMLRPMVKGMKNSVFLYGTALVLVCTIIIPELAVVFLDCSRHIFSVNIRFPLQNNFVICCLMGYYLENRINVNNIPPRSWILLIISSLISSILAVIYLKGAIPTGSNVWLMLFPVGVVYLSVKRAFLHVHLPAKFATALQHLGGAVFSVMIFEGIVRATILTNFPKVFATYGMSYLLTIIVLFICLSLGLILKKLPYIRNIL